VPENFEPLEIVAGMTSGPESGLVIFMLVLLCMWLARRRLMGAMGRWKFWITISVFIAAAMFQSYIVVSRILWPPKDVVFAIAKDGVHCAAWSNVVLPLRHIQNITTMYYAGRFGRHSNERYAIRFDLTAAAPGYPGEVRDLETRVRQLTCSFRAHNIEPGSVERVPAYWRSISQQQ
jgi:hypothetical protein